VLILVAVITLDERCKITTKERKRHAKMK